MSNGAVVYTKTAMCTKTINFIKQNHTLGNLNPPFGSWGGLGGSLLALGVPSGALGGGSWAEKYGFAKEYLLFF